MLQSIICKICVSSLFSGGWSYRLVCPQVWINLAASVPRLVGRMTGVVPTPPSSSANSRNRSHSLTFPRHGAPPHLTSPAPPPPAPSSPQNSRARTDNARRSSASAALNSDQFVIDHLGTMGLGRHQSSLFSVKEGGESAQLQVG